MAAQNGPSVQIRKLLLVCCLAQQEGVLPTGRTSYPAFHSRQASRRTMDMIHPPCSALDPESESEPLQKKTLVTA